jgi:hypothetical protein
LTSSTSAIMAADAVGFLVRRRPPPGQHWEIPFGNER